MVRSISIRRAVAAAVISLFLILVISVGHAQTVPFVSPVTATVVDESGALFPGCEIDFRSDSGTIVSHTGADGSVTVRLQDGIYSVTITRSGFVRTELRNVQIPTSKALRVVMKVGDTPIIGDPGGGDIGLTTIASDLPNIIEPEPTSVPTWHYPDDKSAIRLQKSSKPYSARGLPNGVVAVLTKYRRPGFRVPRPQGGFWEFHEVAKLYYKGQLFALVGSATGISKDGHELGWVTGLVIYDENGRGKLDSPEGVNDGARPFVFHLPTWVKR